MLCGKATEESKGSCEQATHRGSCWGLYLAACWLSLEGRPRSTMWLAKHTIAEVTAKVPFAMIMLHGKVKSNELPPELSLRLLVPSSGLCSMSLWEAPSAEAVEEYCKEIIGDMCETEVFEVYEEACHGFVETVAPPSIAEKLQEKTRQVASAVDAKVVEVDDVLQKTATTVAQNATETIAKWKETVRIYGIFIVKLLPADD